MECIVHFEVEHPEGPKRLRGLIILEPGRLPDENELISMFRDMGFDVTLADRDKLTFKPVNPGDNFSEIRITSLDTGGEQVSEDQILKSIVGNLLPRRPSGL